MNNRKYTNVDELVDYVIKSVRFSAEVENHNPKVEIACRYLVKNSNYLLTVLRYETNRPSKHDLMLLSFILKLKSPDSNCLSIIEIYKNRKITKVMKQKLPKPKQIRYKEDGY